MIELASARFCLVLLLLEMVCAIGMVGLVCMFGWLGAVGLFQFILWLFLLRPG